MSNHAPLDRFAANYACPPTQDNIKSQLAYISMDVHIYAHTKRWAKSLRASSGGMPVDKIKQGAEKFSQHFKRIHGIQIQQSKQGAFNIHDDDDDDGMSTREFPILFAHSHTHRHPCRILPAACMSMCVRVYGRVRLYASGQVNGTICSTTTALLPLVSITSPGFLYQINKTNGPAASEDPRQKLRNYLKQQNKLISKLNARTEKREQGWWLRVLAELGQQWPTVERSTFGRPKQAARPRLNKINRHLSGTSVGKTWLAALVLSPSARRSCSIFCSLMMSKVYRILVCTFLPI